MTTVSPILLVTTYWCITCLQDLLYEAYRFKVNPSSVKSIRTKPRRGKKRTIFSFTRKNAHNQQQRTAASPLILNDLTIGFRYDDQHCHPSITLSTDLMTATLKVVFFLF